MKKNYFLFLAKKLFTNSFVNLFSLNVERVSSGNAKKQNLVFNGQRVSEREGMASRLIRNSYLAFFLVAVSSVSFGQMFPVAGTCTNTVTTNTYGTLNSTTNGSATSRGAIIYNASQLAGISGSTLTSIYFLKANATNLTGTPNFKVYLKETTSTDFGSGALSWTTAVAGATLVYDGNPSTAVAGAAGMKGFVFTTNFFYTGTANLMVLTEYANTGNTGNATWFYEYNSPCVVTTNSNTTKYSTNTTGTPPTSLGSSDYRRPVIGFDNFFTPCAGAVTAGTATSTVVNACASTPFTLSLTGTTIGGGITYQWQSSPQGANNFTNISGATTKSYTIASQTVATDYRCIVTCSNGGSTNTSNVLNIGQNLPSQCYCTPTGANTYYLSNVTSTGGLSNFTHTATSYSAYRDNYNSLSFSHIPGSSLNISMTPSSSTNYFYCWVDWNQDGDFADTGETIWATTAYTANYNGVLPIPAGLAAGDYRVRFANSFSGAITVCGPAANGSYVDVKLVIPAACSGTPTAGTASSSVVNACTNTPFNLSLTGFTAASGLTFQWQSSPVGANTFTNISGATNAIYSVTGQASATDYRCIVTCTVGNANATSNVVSVGQNLPMECYCVPTGADIYYLSNVTSTNGITNFVHTASAYSAYQNKYSTVSFSQKIGGNVNISMTPSSGTNYFYCWVDWNQDGDFTDTGETIWATTSYTANYSGVIPIPAGQAVGEYRVRFANSWSGTITSCGPAASGSYVDVKLQVTLPPVPTLAATKTDVLCHGGTGSATAVVTDGLAPFTYSWSPSGGTAATSTGLVAGTYTVTVIDAANRTATANVTINEPDALDSNIITTNITCNGANNGSVVLAPTGGVAPYTYLWDTGATTSSITNLPAGTYSVTITDANGCTLAETATITDPAVLAIASSSHTDVTWYGGNDGSATVSATGGIAPYTYSWSPSGGTNATATGLIAGNYTVTVTDVNGCTATESFTIIQPIPLMVQSTSNTNVKCNGGFNGTATIVAIGGNAPYTYLWSPSGATNATATGLAAGMHSVLVTDSTGNTITESFTITEPGAILPTISHQSDVLCNGGNNGTATITVTGGTAPFTYTWSNGRVTTNATVSNLMAGNYTVQVTDANGCTATAPVSLTIGQPSALVLTTTGTTNISCYGLNDGSISIAVTGGVAPYAYLWSNGQSGSSINNLGKGTYAVTVTDANNCTQTQSFTITEPAFVTAPTASSQNFCVGQNATLADIVINGSNIKWYSAATGGMLLPATTALVSGTTYYASQTVGTCESTTRTAVQITVGQAPALTTTQLSVCSNTRIQNMMVDGLNYTQLRWYSSATGTIQLQSSILLATGTYYVSSFVGTCESVRQAIQVTVAATVPAPTASFQTVCGGSTLNDLVVVKDPSATLNWYSSMQSMIPLANTTVVATGTYYVQQVLGNCESSRIAVQVQVINITIPTITSITTCEGTTIADLNTNGTNYVWYTDNSTTTRLPSSYVITSGSYYIANENANCISARKNIAVNVSARPASPTGQATQLFNFSAKVSDLVMNEPNVKWFLSANDAAKLINELSATTPLTDATTYYGVIVTPNNCGSLVPTAVKVTINLSNAELDLTQLKYYPNPVDSELNISYIEEIKKVEVFTITGQRVFGNDYQGNEVKVDLSRLSAGTYLVKIETAKASQFVKIVKK